VILTPDGFAINRPSQLWVALQRIGNAIICVFGETKDQVIERMARIRMALVEGLRSNTRYERPLKSDDQ